MLGEVQPYPRKNKHPQTKLGKKKLCQQGNPRENLDADRMRDDDGALDHTANSTSPHVRFLSAYYKIGRQSVRFLPNENDHRFLSASNHEIQMLMLVYAHRQNSRFIHVGGGDRKSAIFGDGVDNEAYRLQRKIRFARKEH